MILSKWWNLGCLRLSWDTCLLLLNCLGVLLEREPLVHGNVLSRRLDFLVVELPLRPGGLGGWNANADHRSGVSLLHGLK